MCRALRALHASKPVWRRHTGRGSFTLAYHGETLQGEATRVDGNSAGFGRIHNEVLGSAPRNSGG